MGSSVKINNRVDMSGKKVSFNTKETDRWQVVLFPYRRSHENRLETDR